MKNDMDLLVKAILEANGIREDIAKIQKAVNKTSVRIPAKIDQNGLLDSVKQIAPDLEKALGKAIGKNIRIDDASLKRAVAQVESAYAKAAQKASAPAGQTAPKASSAGDSVVQSNKAAQKSLEELNAVITKLYKQAQSSISKAFNVPSVISVFTDLMEKIPGTVYEIDAAMMDLHSVTIASGQAYDEFFSRAAVQAQKLGRSITDLIGQTTSWAKLGYSLPDAAELAETSVAYSNLTGIGDSAAISDLTAVMKAFHIEASDSLRIVNSLYQLGNEFPVTTEKLNQGLSNSASSLSASGMSLEKTLALLAGSSEFSQNTAQMSDALNESQQRILGVKDAVSELGESYEHLGSPDTMQSQILNLTQGQVDIMSQADPGKFREYYDILQDIASVYDSLSQSSQTDLLEVLFGSDFSGQGEALIQSFQSGQVQKAYISALSTIGASAQGQGEWLDSIDAKARQLEAAFQSLSKSALSSDLMKGFISAGTGIVNTLDSIIDKIGLLPALIGGINAVMGTSNFGKCA